jgi:isocitrate/isopropylmalate dehydrogenase
MAKRYKVATIAGDGIGLEVLPEGIKVVKAAAENMAFNFKWIASIGPAVITTLNTAK